MAFNSKLQATLGQRGFARDNCLTRDSRSFGATVELLKFHCQEHKAAVLKRAVEFFFSQNHQRSHKPIHTIKSCSLEQAGNNRDVIRLGLQCNP